MAAARANAKARWMLELALYRERARDSVSARTARLLMESIYRMDEGNLHVVVRMLAATSEDQRLDPELRSLAQRILHEIAEIVGDARAGAG